jgi:hypothetical protein
MALFYEWTDTARVWCVEDEWDNLGSSLREYIQVLKEMGCRYVEQMLFHCVEGEYSQMGTSDVAHSI